MRTPCSEWAEKLAAIYPDDLSLAEQQALNTHIESCDACAAVRLEYQAMSSFIHNIGAPPLRSGFPLRLAQLRESQESHGSMSRHTEGRVAKHSKAKVKSMIVPLVPALVSSQKFGAEKPDHPDEPRPEAASLPDTQRSRTTLPQILEKIPALLRVASAIYIAFLTLKEVLSWFVPYIRHLDGKDTIAFTLQQKIKDDNYTIVQGVFNARRNIVENSRIIKSQSIEEELARLHKEQSIVLYF